MTLILTICYPDAAYQSSDFQLTRPNGVFVSDADGSKQLHATLGNLHLQLAFTGLASIGSRRTIDWLQAEFNDLLEKDFDDLCQALAARSAKEIGPIHATLTIVITACSPKEGVRLAQISNYASQAQFDVSIQRITRPLYLISGYAKSVADEQRRLLKRLIHKSRRPPESMLDLLASINVASARRSEGLVSAGCWVAAQWIESGGQVKWVARSTGGHGSVQHSFNGQNVTREVKKQFRAAPGAELRVVQSAGLLGGDATPNPLPEGMPREFKLGETHARLLLHSPTGVHCATIEATHMPCSITVRRNESALVPISFSFKVANGLVPDFPESLAPWPYLELPLVVDGVTAPRPGQMSVKYWVQDGVHYAELPNTSRGVRDISFLEDDEEMLVLSPTRPITLTNKPGEQEKKENGQAFVWWRARLDGTNGPTDNLAITISEPPAPSFVAVAETL